MPGNVLQFLFNRFPCEMDVALDPEFCVETFFDSPSGSPVEASVLHNIDFLNINGRFTPRSRHSSERPSTSMSMVSYSSSSSQEFLVLDDNMDDYLVTSSGLVLRGRDLAGNRVDTEPSSRPSTSMSEILMTPPNSPEKSALRRASLAVVPQKTSPDSKRRHSVAPVYTYNPIPGNRNIFFKTDKNHNIKPIKIANYFSKTPEATENDIDKKQEEELCYPNCDVNVWLRSCEEEIIQPLEGVTTGTIPTWLNGSLLRNGPGSLKVGEMTFSHLFDSSALLHRFEIKQGRVTYQCRFLQSDTYKKNHAAQRIVVTEFGTSAVPDPCQSIFQKVSAIFKQPGENSSDNAMISIYPFGDEFFAFTESPVIHRINPETLDTEERVNLSEYLGIINHTSHPHVMADGVVYNLGQSVTKTGPVYTILCFPHGENMFKDAHIVASVPARWRLHPSYMHTFGITDRFFIIVEQPLTVSVPAVIKSQLTNQPMATCLKWFENRPTMIYLLNRSDGELAYTFQAEAFFYLHIINQYERDDHVVLDICCYKDPAMLNCMYVEHMRNMQKNPDYAKMFRGRPLRFVLPLKKPGDAVKTSLHNFFNTLKKSSSLDFDDEGLKKRALKKSKSTSKLLHFKELELARNLVTLTDTRAEAYQLPNGGIFCKPELLCNLGCETPRVYYEEHLGREYQYFYAISSDVDATNPGTLIKVDVVNKTRKTWCEDNCYPSEPIFVASPDPQSEDDGVILSAMVWGHAEENRVGLLVLCAKTMTEIGRCEFKTNSPVPKCLHGWYAAVK